MNQEPTVRRAVLADAEAIGDLHARSWKSAYRGILADELLDAITVEGRVAQRRKHLAEPLGPEVRNWVLEHEGAVRGWACIGVSRDEDVPEGTGELMAIYLPPEHVGRGYGRRLMEHSLADAVEQGYREMTMWVLAGNERAQRFYRKAGFVADERISPEVFGETGALKVRMWRLLR